MADLTHWNLRDEFAVHEIAALCVGIDPNARDVPHENGAKATFLREELKKTARETWEWAANNHEKIYDRIAAFPWEVEPISKIFPPGRVPFISEHLYAEIFLCELHANGDDECRFGDIVAAFQSNTPDVFCRREILRWMKEKGISSTYDFSSRKARTTDSLAAKANIDCGPQQPETKPTLLKDFGARERTTLLVTIAALLKENRMTWNEHAKTGDYIERITNSLDARVASRTAQDFLKKIPDALERKKGEDKTK